MWPALRSSSLEEHFFHRGRRRCLLLCALELELPCSRLGVSDVDHIARTQHQCPRLGLAVPLGTRFRQARPEVRFMRDEELTVGHDADGGGCPPLLRASPQERALP